jgi:hypothetical protein
MTSKTQVLNVARLIVGLCIGAGLFYFLYSNKSPPVVGLLITAAVFFFVIISRRSGVYDNSPVFRKMALGSSEKPFRDFGLAVLAFVAMLAVTIAIAAGVKNKVFPDNWVSWGFLIAVIIVGMLAIIYFMFGVITRAFFGPPPP